MHSTVLYVAAVWTGLLLLAGVVRVVTAGSPLSRLLALDMIGLILIALLVVQAAIARVPFYLDAALAFARLSVGATVAAARYHSKGRPV